MRGEMGGEVRWWLGGSRFVLSSITDCTLSLTVLVYSPVGQCLEGGIHVAGVPNVDKPNQSCQIGAMDHIRQTDLAVPMPHTSITHQLHHASYSWSA